MENLATAELQPFETYTIRRRPNDYYIDLNAIAINEIGDLQTWEQRPDVQQMIASMTELFNYPVFERTKPESLEGEGVWAHPFLAVQFLLWCNPKNITKVAFIVSSERPIAEMKTSIPKATS